MLPAIIASIQATEAIKMFTNIGHSLSGRLLLYDALNMSFETLVIQKNPDCPICSSQPTMTTLGDYEQLCGLSSNQSIKLYQQLTPLQLQHLIETEPDIVLIDVREDYERAICEIAGSVHIPMAQISEQMARFKLDQALVFHCKLGGRSAKICQQFIDNGYQNISNLEGGILAWANQVNDDLTRY